MYLCMYYSESITSTTMFSLVVLVISILIVLINDNEDQKILSNDLNNGLNTTVVILNWSRFTNVKQIISNVCDQLLDDTVASIIIWNNNPTPLALKVCLDLLSMLHFSKVSFRQGFLSYVMSGDDTSHHQLT